MTAHAAHTRQNRLAIPLHVRHADKIAKVGKRSRLWCEIVTCAGTAYEAHTILLVVASIVWLVVDVALVLIGKTAEIA